MSRPIRKPEDDPFYHYRKYMESLELIQQDTTAYDIVDERHRVSYNHDEFTIRWLINKLTASEATMRDIRERFDESVARTARLESENTKLIKRLEQLSHISAQNAARITELERQIAGSTNALIPDQTECVACLDALANVTILPCKHTCLCVNCYTAWKDVKGTCPICRAEISNID